MKFNKYLGWTCENCGNTINECECLMQEENFETEEVYNELMNRKAEILSSVTQFNRDECLALLEPINYKINNILWTINK